MVVPKSVQLRPGVCVNVVLKADQKSGKLTTGQVAETLTKGDHPRGIKVRMTNGQIGRVQSIAGNATAFGPAEVISAASAAHNKQNNHVEHSPQLPRSIGSRECKGKLMLQEDYRKEATPLESHSLADYIKVSPSRLISTRPRSPTKDKLQTQFEQDFPSLDTALIAAILADNDEPEAAKAILSALL